MTTETLPITKEVILAQVTALGGTITETIEVLAATIAAKLAEQDVQMRSDGQQVSPRTLADAACATEGLLDLRLTIPSFMLETEARRHDPALADTRQTATQTYNASIAVQAAVSTLLGDADDPTIDHYRSTLHRAALVSAF